MKLTPPDGRLSDSIAIARVLCILGVVYVHAWTGLNGEALEALRQSPQEIFRWLLMDMFGRSAVPLLGLVSGWLVAGSRRTADWRSHVKHKARTILMPMVAWNILAIIFVSGAAICFGLLAPVPHTIGWVLEELFILTRNPDINVQMPFLRDLFLCMIVAPLLIRLPKYLVLFIGLLAFVAQVSGYGPPILMRPSILFFFSLGIWVRQAGLAKKAAQITPALITVPFLSLMLVQLWIVLNPTISMGRPTLAALDMVYRVVSALFYWRVSWALSGSRLRPTLMWIEPYMFFLFCGHLILIWLFGPLLGKIFGHLGDRSYPLYLLAQPFLILLAMIGISKLLLRLFPSAAMLLSGGRLKRAPDKVIQAAARPCKA